jgi:homoserine/homoserine lactone efflux protein
MHWEVFAAFAVTNLLFAFTPGPAVLLTVSHGMRGGVRDALKVGLGVQAGNSVYFTLSAIGLGALLQASETAFHAVKWIGAAYLVWLGVRTWRNARRQAEAAAKPAVPSGARPFLDGVLTQLANPKSVLFFGAMMPQFIDPAGPLVAQYALFGLICVVVEMPVLLGYGWLAAHGRAYSRRSPRFALWRERVSGGLLIGVGASLAAIRRVA